MKSKHLTLISLHADPAAASGVGEGGGTHAYVRELMIGLSGSDWSVTVLTRWAKSELPECEMLASSVRLVRIRIGEVAEIDKRLLADLHSTSLAAASEALLVGPKVDVVHSVYWNSGRVAMDLSQRWGVPFVHTVISNGWRRRYEGLVDEPFSRLEVERLVFAAALVVFCVSNQERTDLIEHYSVDPGKIIVVGRPVARSFQQTCRDEMGRPSVPSPLQAL